MVSARGAGALLLEPGTDALRGREGEREREGGGREEGEEERRERQRGGRGREEGERKGERER